MSKFELGRLVATPGALAKLDECGVMAAVLLAQHAAGDWGDLCPEDAAENELSLKQGFRLMSVYHVDRIKFWLITEADRSATTILLPEEY